MNQSKTKSTITLIALLSIGLVFLLLVISIIEINQYHDYKQQIASQERQIEDLNNEKDYYKNKLTQNDTYDENDFVFEVK